MDRQSPWDHRSFRHDVVTEQQQHMGKCVINFRALYRYIVLLPFEEVEL